MGKKLEKQENYFDTQKQEEESNDMLSFFLGVVLLGVGLFWLTKRIIVHSGWYTWHFGGLSVSFGLVTVPLIIGIIWKFYNPKSKIPNMIIVLGALFIVATIIMSVKITFMPTSLYEYIIMIGFMAAGSGLLLKVLFKKKN